MEEERIVNDQHIEEKQEEAYNISCEHLIYNRKLHYIYLHPLTPDEYYESLKDKRQYGKFKEPRIKDFRKGVGITAGLIAKAFIFKEAKEELKNKGAEAKVLHKNDVEQAWTHYKKRRERFYNRQQSYNATFDLLKERLTDNDREQMVNYIEHALNSDNFSVDFQHQFDINVRSIDYNSESSELLFSYRIPDLEEILVFSRYEYDEEEDEIKPIEPDKKLALERRMSIARSILLRAAVMVYLSDAYQNIKNVYITGFLLYYDSAFGDMQIKNVIKVGISKEDFDNTKLETVKVEELFKRRLNAQESSGLYSKKPYELKEK